MTAISFRQSTLPWALAHDDEERFRKLFLALMGFVIVFGIALRLNCESRKNRRKKTPSQRLIVARSYSCRSASRMPGHVPASLSRHAVQDRNATFDGR